MTRQQTGLVGAIRGCGARISFWIQPTWEEARDAHEEVWNPLVWQNSTNGKAKIADFDFCDYRTSMGRRCMSNDLGNLLANST